jgi:lysophospholipase L1-like esterase
MTVRSLISVTASLIALVAVSGASPATQNGGPPTSIAALGDSITNAACASGTSCTDARADSWATGTSPAVDSQLLRLRAIFRNGTPVRAFNFASDSFVTMADLVAQARQAVRVRAAYVTIEIGENDLCAYTPVAKFRAELRRGLAALADGRRKILLLSIENLAAHWRVLDANPAARKAFKAGGGIDCGLGDSASGAYLAQIEARARALNAVEAEACSAVPYCLYDGGAYFRLPLRARYFSAADYQHLSVAGQRALAAAEWKVALRFLYD